LFFNFAINPHSSFIYLYYEYAFYSHLSYHILVISCRYIKVSLLLRPIYLNLSYTIQSLNPLCESPRPHLFSFPEHSHVLSLLVPLLDLNLTASSRKKEFVDSMKCQRWFGGTISWTNMNLVKKPQIYYYGKRWVYSPEESWEKWIGLPIIHSMKIKIRIGQHKCQNLLGSGQTRFMHVDSISMPNLGA
jgi:hypothetical protein